MMTVRRSRDRGAADLGWLRSHHTFSFASYHDPAHMGFGSLRVINEDHIQGGGGFDPHPHRDMEIITYIIAGALEHRDSMGNTAVIRPGEVQHMSAGQGVVHSEYNYLKDEETHLLQIWILPKTRGLSPSYGQKDFSASLARSPMVLAASGDGREGSITIHQDADLYVIRLQGDQPLSFALRPQRQAWLQVVKGSVKLLGVELYQGDGAAVTDEALLSFTSSDDAELLLFDLAS